MGKKAIVNDKLKWLLAVQNGDQEANLTSQTSHQFTKQTIGETSFVL